MRGSARLRLLISAAFVLASAAVGHTLAQSAACAGGEHCVYMPVAAGSERQAAVVLPTPLPPTAAPPTATRGPAVCDPSYPTVCIPPPPPDLDCSDIPYRRFAVIGADPHGFDSDHDGVGCESG